MGKIFLYILGGLITLIGIGLIVYPLFSNFLYEKRQSELVEYYEEKSKQISTEERSSQWAECYEYNKGLLTGETVLTDSFSNKGKDSYDARYNMLLDPYENGIMGSVEVPGLIDPIVIYHGTSDNVLQKGAGHLYGTSLPVGGTGTHCVITTHTGLPDKILFTNLDQIKNGDVFYLNILGETLAYMVDQIKVVLPGEIDEIRIDPNEDYVTLVTCTPYGVNSHRLLARGKRIPYEEAVEKETSQKQQKSNMGFGTWLSMYFAGLVISLIAIGSIIFIIILIKRIREKRKC